jgi:hypothetical protein
VRPIRMSRVGSRPRLLGNASPPARPAIRAGHVSDTPAVRVLAERPDILVAWTFT